MKTYKDFIAHNQKIADINHATAVLHWDKETYLPKGSAKFRTQQVATLSAVTHNLSTQDNYGYLLHSLKEQDLSLKQKTNVLRRLKEYQKAILFDEDFIKLKSYLISNTFHAWLQAREDGNWADYYPVLKKLIDLKIEEAQKLGFEEHPYDALLDYYEPNATVKQLDVIFDDVEKQLLPILKKIREAKQVDDSFLRQHFPFQDQWDFGIDILNAMGYDMECGRQDVSAHPFTISFAPTDVRVTTRVNEDNFAYMLWSTIHEGGHALYEQGLPEKEYGIPSGEPISLSIHESQSRLWENNVGRSFEFWQYYYPKLVDKFPEQFDGVELEEFYNGINKVNPNLIRTESDELHYHFHILVRYQLEKGILSGDIPVKEMRDFWNASYKRYFNLEPSNDKEGILQDIHWAHGSVGYFPTYSLGSFYAAQFYRQAQDELKDKLTISKNGNMRSLLLWLREKIHQHGHQYEANELCLRITGKELQLDDFIDYIKNKYSKIYQIEFN